MNGNNNNPTATQYLSAYKKVTVHKLNITIPSSANCNPLDDTELISEEVYDSAAKSSEKVLTHETKFQVSEVHQFLQQDHHVFEHSYSKFLNSDWTSSEYADEIVKYAAGSIIRMLKNKTKCSKCCDLLDGSSSSLKSKLIDLKNRGGLHFASDDVNFICMYTEKNIRSTENLLRKDINKTLIAETLKSLPPNVLDDNDQDHLELHFKVQREHLILSIIQKYIDMRLNHEGKMLNDQNQRVRMHNNKMTIFKGN